MLKLRHSAISWKILSYFEFNNNNMLGREQEEAGNVSCTKKSNSFPSIRSVGYRLLTLLVRKVYLRVTMSLRNKSLQYAICALGCKVCISVYAMDNICPHSDNLSFREDLAFSSKTMPNHTLHQLQHQDFMEEGSGWRTGLTAVQSFQPLWIFGVS